MSFDADVYFNGQRKELYRLHKELIEIESISGDENSVGIYLKTYLEGLGYTVEWQPVPGKTNRERANVYAYKGTERNTQVLLTSHIDTVPPYFGYRVEGDRIYGRGSVDDKNCVAAMIVALEELFAEKRVTPEDVGLLFVVEEEVGGPGMQFANKNLDIKSWKSVIFGEPTEMKLGIGHKGVVMFDYVAHGKAAHSGYPELGINATSKLIDALYKLTHSPLPRSDLLGESTINVGIINGGVAGNVIPEYAKATIIIRVAKNIEKILEIVNSIAAEFDLEVANVYSVPEQSLDFKVPGFDGIALSFVTDVANLDGNFKRFLYGSGSIHVAHSDHEYVPIKELYDSVDGYKKLVQFSLENH